MLSNSPLSTESGKNYHKLKYDDDNNNITTSSFFFFFFFLVRNACEWWRLSGWGLLVPKIRHKQYRLTYSLLQCVILILETLNLYSYGNVKVLTSALILHSGFFILLHLSLLRTTAIEERWMLANWSFCICLLAPIQIFPEETEKATHWQSRQSCENIWHFRMIFPPFPQYFQHKLSSVLFYRVFKLSFSISL